MINTKTAGIIMAAMIFIVGIISGIVLDRAFLSGPKGFHFPLGRPAAKKAGPGGLLPRLGKAPKLTAAQNKRITTLLDEQKRKIDEITKDIHPRVEAQMADFRENVRNILDDAQRKKYDKMTEKHKRRRMETGKYGGKLKLMPPPPPPAGE